MASEWREETCEDCGATIEREWIGRTVAVKRSAKTATAMASRGERYATGGGWRTKWTRTPWTTLCDCDVAF